MTKEDLKQQLRPISPPSEGEARKIVKQFMDKNPEWRKIVEYHLGSAHPVHNAPQEERQSDGPQPNGALRERGR